MQSVMEAVSMQPASSRSNLSLGASTYPAVVNALPDRLAPSLTSTSGHQYSFQPPLPPTCPPTSSSAVLNGLPTPPISNGAYPHMPISNVVTTTSYLIPEQASPAVTSNNFSQHHQDANTAAAVAAAACFGEYSNSMLHVRHNCFTLIAFSRLRRNAFSTSCSGCISCFAWRNDNR